VVASLLGGSAHAADRARTPELAKDAPTILADAKAVSSSRSVVVTGHVVSHGKLIELSIESGRGWGDGSISTDGVTLAVSVRPPAFYFFGDPASIEKLTQSSAAGHLFGGKWLRTTTSDPRYGQLAEVFDGAGLIRRLGRSGTLTKGAVTTFNEQKVIPLVASDGTIYVAATGKPYVVGLVGTGPDNDGTQLIFSLYGVAHKTRAPRRAINISPIPQASTA
jgi:hypothetical protein